MTFPFITDPKDGKKSVSLTLLTAASVLMIGFSILEAFTTVKSTATLDELFLTAVALYFGRRSIGLNGKQINLGDDSQPPKEQ